MYAWELMKIAVLQQKIDSIDSIGHGSIGNSQYCTSRWIQNTYVSLWKDTIIHEHIQSSPYISQITSNTIYGRKNEYNMQVA